MHYFLTINQLVKLNLMFYCHNVGSSLKFTLTSIWIWVVNSVLHLKVIMINLTECMLKLLKYFKQSRHFHRILIFSQLIENRPFPTARPLIMIIVSLQENRCELTFACLIFCFIVNIINNSDNKCSLHIKI